MLTHRRTILDSAKLEYLNKHHLVRTRSTESGLRALALRGQGHVKDAFPHTSVVPTSTLFFGFVLGVQQINSRTFTSVEYIEKVICALQGRLVTLMDLPTVAPYFFVPPAWADAEARAMLDGISTEDYQIVMRGTAERLKSASPWDMQTLADALHAESRAGAIKPAKFMTALRHALSGTKVNPSFENDGLRI